MSSHCEGTEVHIWIFYFGRKNTTGFFLRWFSFRGNNWSQSQLSCLRNWTLCSKVYLFPMFEKPRAEKEVLSHFMAVLDVCAVWIATFSSYQSFDSSLNCEHKFIRRWKQLFSHCHILFVWTGFFTVVKSAWFAHQALLLVAKYFLKIILLSISSVI